MWSNPRRQRRQFYRFPFFSRRSIYAFVPPKVHKKLCRSDNTGKIYSKAIASSSHIIHIYIYKFEDLIRSLGWNLKHTIPLFPFFFSFFQVRSTPCLQNLCRRHSQKQQKKNTFQSLIAQNIIKKKREQKSLPIHHPVPSKAPKDHRLANQTTSSWWLIQSCLLSHSPKQ